MFPYKLSLPFYLQLATVQALGLELCCFARGRKERRSHSVCMPAGLMNAADFEGQHSVIEKEVLGEPLHISKYLYGHPLNLYCPLK